MEEFHSWLWNKHFIEFNKESYKRGSRFDQIFLTKEEEIGYMISYLLEKDKKLNIYHIKDKHKLLKHLKKRIKKGEKNGMGGENKIFRK